MTTSKAFVELVDGFSKPPPAIESKGHAMTTLEEFVRDGVVKCILDVPRGPTTTHYIMQDEKSPTDELYLHDNGALSVGTKDCDWTEIVLTPTQLRALSAMALWAAESMERKNNA